MGHAKINSWKDCTKSDNITKFAKENNLEIRECAGSHKMMKDNKGNSMTYYEGDISTGVACKIFKWFRNIGLIAVFFFVLYLRFFVL